MKHDDLLKAFETLHHSYVEETVGKTVMSSDRFYKFFNFELTNFDVVNQN